MTKNALIIELFGCIFNVRSCIGAGGRNLLNTNEINITFGKFCSMSKEVVSVPKKKNSNFDVMKCLILSMVILMMGFFMVEGKEK